MARMMPMVVMAVVGAALGAFMRPRVFAVALAIGLAGGLRGLLLYIARLAPIGDNGPPAWSQTLSHAFAGPLASYMMVMVAGGGGALFAALMCLLLDEKPVRPFWMPPEGDMRLRDRTGRYVRAAELIAERPIHAEAERRIQANLNT